MFLNEVKFGSVVRFGTCYYRVGLREVNGEIRVELVSGLENKEIYAISPKELFHLTPIEREEGPEIRSIFEVEIAETVAKQLASSGHLDREV